MTTISIKTILNNLSNRNELIIILVIGFGIPIWASTLLALLTPSLSNPIWLFKLTSQGFYSIIVYEILAFIVIIYVLKVRGWKYKDIYLKFSFSLVYISILLLLLRNILGIITYMGLVNINLINDVSIHNQKYILEADWLSIFLILVVNSIYEEFILIGYLFKRLKKHNPIFIIIFSLIIRSLYHSYQGWDSLIVVLPSGLVFGYYYYKYKKLWSIIIAHGFGNLFTLLSIHF